MNIVEKFSDLEIDPNKLTKKKQQTSKKIEYVSEYVRLWAFVMLERDDIHTLNFVDCMCNAGVYHDGDCCTAVEILQIFSSLAEKYPRKNFRIWCNDNDPEKIKILKRVLGLFPENRQIQMLVSQCDVNDYLDMLYQGVGIARRMFEYGSTTILYVDPFDFGTVEIPKVSAVLKKHYCELLFNFFVSDYVRNIRQDAGRIAKCLGGKKIETKDELIAYMRTQLRVGHIKHLFSYQFRTEKNVELYQIVFATPSSRGLEKLKDVLWKVFKGAEFHRNHADNDQMCLFTAKDDEDYSLHTYATEAKALLCQKYMGQAVSWHDIELFLIEHTMLKESQIIRHVLRPLIETGAIKKHNLYGKSNYKADSYTFSAQGELQ